MTLNPDTEIARLKAANAGLLELVAYRRERIIELLAARNSIAAQDLVAESAALAGRVTQLEDALFEIAAAAEPARRNELAQAALKPAACASEAGS
jgi:hypothetical protein